MSIYVSVVFNLVVVIMSSISSSHGARDNGLDGVNEGSSVSSISSANDSIQDRENAIKALEELISPGVKKVGSVGKV